MQEFIIRSAFVQYMEASSCYPTPTLGQYAPRRQAGLATLAGKSRHELLRTDFSALGDVMSIYGKSGYMS
jgi:hypothetical protein